VNDRLYRSPTDRVIAGVAGGLAVWLNIDPSIVRLVWVLLAIFSGGIFVLVYIVMMIVVPLPPPGWTPRPAGWADGSGQSGWQPGGWQSGSGWQSGGGTSWQPGAGTGWQPGAPGAPADPGQPAPPPASGGWSSYQPPSASRSPSLGGYGAGLLLGAILIVLGVWFLIDRYVRIDWGVLWPVIVIVLGVGLIAAAIRRGGPGAGG
jgi:phage shock protein C